MEVHPGITTLASCIVIALMLGVYLSMGTINSFFNRLRLRFRSGRTPASRRDTEQLEMTLTTDQKVGKEAILIKANQTEISREETAISNETLSGYDKSNRAINICASTETGKNRCKTKAIDSPNKSPIITSATLICTKLYNSTKSIVNESNKCGLTAEDNNLSRDVEIPLISAC